MPRFGVSSLLFRPLRDRRIKTGRRAKCRRGEMHFSPWFGILLLPRQSWVGNTCRMGKREKKREKICIYSNTSTTVNMAPQHAPNTRNKRTKQDKVVCFFWLQSCRGGLAFSFCESTAYGTTQSSQLLVFAFFKNASLMKETKSCFAPPPARPRPCSSPPPVWSRPLGGFGGNVVNQVLVALTEPFSLGGEERVGTRRGQDVGH